MSQWPLSEKGLLYDREWLVLAENGVALNQKQDSQLCTISPCVDLEQGTLTLSAPGERCGVVKVEECEPRPPRLMQGACVCVGGGTASKLQMRE